MKLPYSNPLRADSSSNLLALTSLTLLLQSIQALTSLPPPTGRYNVGVLKATIPHLNTADPLAPGNVSTAFLATIYYPTLQEPSAAVGGYLEPELAAILETQFHYAGGFLSTFTSSVQTDAPFLPLSTYEGEVLPTLLFGPGGGGPPVQGNTILIAELASHGYTVVGLDHPYEQPFIRFPDDGYDLGGVDGVDINYADNALLEAIYATRIEDAKVFLEIFPNLTRSLGAPFDTERIAAFGYSLGGAQAIGSLYDGDLGLASGINLDGALWGQRPVRNDSEADAVKPVLFLGNELHVGDDEEYDITWATFPLWQTDFRLFTINGSTHHDFCDDTFWKTIMPTDPSAGPIDGNRMYRIVNAYVKAFFDLTLLGRTSPLLEGPSSEWPEVVYYG